MKFYKPLLIFIVLTSCYSVINAQVVVDSIVMYQRDSAVIPETESTVMFFQSAERMTEKDIAKTTIITKTRKTMKLSSFLKSGGTEYADVVLADLDNDGKKELMISGFTGGAHCCDDIYVFKNIAPNKYQYAARLFAGHTVINAEKEFTYSFAEHFGYFFTCYACWYSDTSDAAPVDLSGVTMKYSKGKFVIAPGDKELRSTINDNLDKLGELVTDIPSDGDGIDQDEGIRKAVAMNLAVFYYSFGKNLVETQKLFNKYYLHKDAKKVWAEFIKTLKGIKNESDF